MKQRRATRGSALFCDEVGITVAAFGLFASISIPVLCYFVPEISSIHCTADRVFRIIGCAAAAVACVWSSASLLIHGSRVILVLALCACFIACFQLMATGDCCDVVPVSDSSPTVPIHGSVILCFLVLIAVHVGNQQALRTSSAGNQCRSRVRGHGWPKSGPSRNRRDARKSVLRRN